MSHEDTQKMPDSVMKYWPIILCFLGLAVTWGTFLARFSSAEADISKLETRVSETDTTLTTIRVDISEIKTSLNFIKEKVK